ncbi:MAG: hypothetical protein CEO22_57 [Candidatus Berkelbacteria bacterium Gr01-1014_85]|uniref:Uncharacterized protein n=1 Tax=Candidatus Berkelbacteria bacterium Gr01-1014_85 TaxID=2017150 RepID=A0A554JE28_9BACT|nr:MAG: hypothetical protein CEO22_57 [Candidatus Berkelbacteria bacterium Gr01-1014_85]
MFQSIQPRQFSQQVRLAAILSLINRAIERGVWPKAKACHASSLIDKTIRLQVYDRVTLVLIKSNEANYLGYLNDWLEANWPVSLGSRPEIVKLQLRLGSPQPMSAEANTD